MGGRPRRRRHGPRDDGVDHAAAAAARYEVKPRKRP